ncbi:MAG: SMC-Scp complex subunit ScpB [Candidatus Ryanbacteria bacterium]|nr:SMC-Scp complex subunit ScpB [Candidatus Ryanbacteria bacterium]
MELEKIVEAILFAAGEPVKIKDLVRLTGTKKSELDAALQALRDTLLSRGLRLVEHDDEFTLATAPEVSEIASRIARERLEGDLSRTTLETLTIILWKGKVSRSSIDYIRGVNSAFSLRTLLVRGLIEREQDSKDARVFLYKPTLDLLKYLGISSTKELPHYSDIERELEDYV